MIEVQFLKEKIDELRPLVPPVAVELGVVRRDDKRGVAFEGFAKFVGLLDALADEVVCVLSGLLSRKHGDVRFL